MSGYDAPPPPGYPPPEPNPYSAHPFNAQGPNQEDRSDPFPDPAGGWQRLDPRMLLVHPVREVVRFLPAVIIIVFVGSSSRGGSGWQFFALLAPIVIGLAKYLTTTYRITEARVELRTGLLSRRITSTPLDRVRTIDLTSSLIQRLLGLTTLRIGTGTGGEADRLDLDGLPIVRAQEVRQNLLRNAKDDERSGTDGLPAGMPPTPAEPEQDAAPVVAFDPAWLRYAPLTSSGLVIAAAAIGGGSQLLGMLDFWDDFDPETWSLGAPVGLVITGAVVLFALAVAVLAILGYLVANWNFTLARSGGSWRVSRGLFTTRETSLDEDRIAGVTLVEGLGLRPLRGGRLNAIATGLDRSQATASALVPPAPVPVSLRAAEALLGTCEPLTASLIPHGRAAATRRYVRALVPSLLLAAGLAAFSVAGDALVLLPLALVPPALGVALARDRVRSLGHAFVQGRVVSRSGSLARQRSALGADHVIGWNFRATWFQRRVGLTTAVATMAGGPQAVAVLDVPEDRAIALAAQTLPDVMRQFLAEPTA